jgi:UDP-N-acetylmuramate dehydrogenase
MPDWAQVFNDEMADFWSGEVLWNCSLAPYTTLGVGGPAEAIIFPRGINELSQLMQGLRKINVSWHVIGRGSNIVVHDNGVNGVVIIFGRSFSTKQKIEEKGDSIHLKVDAGHSLSGLVNWTMEQGLSGMEFATGIPGTVGGAIVMNAGAWGREMSDVLLTVTMLDEAGNIISKGCSDMDFRYRSWGEVESMIAVGGVFQLYKKDSEKVKSRCHEIQEDRKKKQPLKHPSAGSFFKNPPGEKSAGQLIEEAGLKGVNIGGAQVSPVHANFIVNTGAASARDIIQLMQKVQQEVEKTSGICLEPEVKFLGWE